MAAMTPRERVWAALRGDPVDRPPVSFWGHFYHREATAVDLVEATLEHQREYGWDWVKLNPRKHYHVEDWGVRYRYSGRAAEKPVLEAWPVYVLFSSRLYNLSLSLFRQATVMASFGAALALTAVVFLWSVRYGIQRVNRLEP